MQKSKLGRALRSVAVVAVAVPFLTAGSCTDKVTGGNRNPAGNYVLASIEQQGFAKCTISQGSCKIEHTGNDLIMVSSGALQLAANNSFVMSVSGSKNGAAQSVAGIAGTWAETQSGASFTVPGVPVAIPATWASANADALVFVLPAQTFSASQGSVTVTFSKN